MTASASPGFAEFLKPIQKLWLAVASDHSPDYRSICGIQFYNRFWMDDIPVFLKFPYLPYKPHDPDRETWDSLFYPNLTALRLHCIWFYGPPDTGAEGFIVRHAASLKKLDISTCMVAKYGGGPNPKTSARIFHHFQEKLKKPRGIYGFPPVPGQIRQTKSQHVDANYFAHLIGGQEYMCILDDVESGLGTDYDAYQSLQNSINSRRRLLE